MNLTDAAYLVVHDYPGGAASLAPRIGRNTTTLNHEVNRTGSAKLGLEDAEKITQRTGDLRILQAFATNCGQLLVPLPHLPPGPAKDCLDRLGDLLREVGELVTEVAGCTSDGEITDNELRRIDRAGGDVFAAWHAMRCSVAALNARGKPGALSETGAA